MTAWKPLLLVILALLSACGAPNLDRIRAVIDAEIQKGVAATRVQDIDTYMALIPEGSVVHNEVGSDVDRDQLRAHVLRDWAIIDTTMEINVVIDSLSVIGDSAQVYTSQRWERMMFRRDGVARDTVLTTQQHRESWRVTQDGWRSFVTEELGGTVTINGEPYSPPE